MYKVFSLAALLVTVSALGAGDAFAQRGRSNSGIPKPHYGSGSPGRTMGRGMMGGGVMGRSYSYYPQPSRPYYSQPAPLAYNRSPQAESYRVFSFEPIGINPGDTVVVSRGDVKLMRGPNAVGEVPQGLQFRVTKVINGWLGAVVDVNGQQLKGWIWNRDVRLAEEAPPIPPTGT
ncbi:MAG: hypothetical protein KY475_27815 [Planctomycetes bacterium]|nr:hypothetical protein [Planctomycetota bacterium]